MTLRRRTLRLMRHDLSCGVPIDTVLEARSDYEIKARAEQAHLDRQAAVYRAAYRG